MKQVKCESCHASDFEDIGQHMGKPAVKCAYCRTIYYDEKYVEQQREHPRHFYDYGGFTSCTPMPFTMTSYVTPVGWR